MAPLSAALNRPVRQVHSVTGRAAPAPRAPQAPRAPGVGIGPTPGSYDPALDAAQQNAQTGLGQKLAQIQTQGQRADSQYLINTGQVQHTYGNQVADATQSHAYAGQDIQRAGDIARQGEQNRLGQLAQQLGYAQQDYGTHTAANVRNFQQLGAAQTARAEQTGNGDSGALAAALVQRGQNQGLVQNALDTSFHRQQAANAFAQQQAREGLWNTISGLGNRQQRSDAAFHQQTDPYNPANPTGGRLAYNLAQQLGHLGTQHEYGAADLATQAAQDQENYNQFALQTQAQKAYSAAQNAPVGG